VEEEPLEVKVVARSGRLRFPGGELVEPLLEAPAPLPRGARKGTFRIAVRFGRRGVRRLAPPALVIRDPLGLAARRLDGAGPEDEVLVLPRTGAVHVRAEGASALMGRPDPVTAGAAEIDLDGLRPYREGTPASRIHWAPLARGRDLLERRLRPDADSRPLIVLDPRAPARAEDLDAAVRAAASLCLELARHGGCAVLLPGDRRATALTPELGGWPALHARLALVEAGRAPSGAAAAAARFGTLFYVAARPLNTIPIRGASARRVLVVPAELPGRRSLLEVMGCRGYEISTGHRRAGAAAA
jgi:uncharacterized protein (DUF58 family)